MVLIAIILLLTGIVAAIFINYRYTVDDATKPEQPEETDAAFTINAFEHTAMKNGEREWTLKADKARLFSDTQKADLYHIETVFFMDNGEQIKMSAEYGELDMAAKDIRAQNNVVVDHPDYKLRTERLNYNYESRILVIDNRLTITNDTLVLTADSARHEMADNKTIFKGNIESSVNDRIHR